MHRRSFCCSILFPIPALFALAVADARADFQNFESPPVHPVEISQDGTRLFAVHTADHRVVIFDLSQGSAPVKTAEIPVGIEPVTVRQRTANELWVVNHVSDSINIIDLTTQAVVTTLVTGDEPTDVVFAGNPERAFVCISQEDLIRVYDPANLAAPPVDIPLDMSDPMSLAVSNDNATVYVSALDSQNETTAIPFDEVEAGGGPPAPSPPMSGGLPEPPRTSLIVKHDGSAWRDEAGTSWNAFVGYTLLDHDVVEISAASLAITSTYSNVGTSLFGMAVSPADGRLYVSNQEAFNEVRFEPNLKGRFLENRVTVIDPAGSTVTPRHLNDHIDYGNEDGTAGERALSLSMPLGVATNDTGSEIYVAAFGSAKVGVLDAGGTLTRRIDVGDGPAGVAHDAPRDRLYVWNRFSSSVSVVDLSDDSSFEVSLGFDPTPDNVRAGRALFYSGENSSAHGDLSCASCHLFGGMDNLAWDLGDPQGEFVPPDEQFLNGFHPMKGPMTTQSLKGLSGTEPFHWRGDRLDLEAFNSAFVSLMGRTAELPPSEFSDFEDFVFSLTYPPNPNRELDGSLPNPGSGPNPLNGESLYMNGSLVGGVECVDCHSLPTGENGIIIPAALLQEDQDMVVPQLRNMYEKTRFDNTASTTVRGFGFTHDGAIDDLFSFLDFPAFTFQNDDDQRDVEAFMLAFDTGTPVAMGAQWTMDGTNEAAGTDRLNTFLDRAGAGEIGLIAKGRDLALEARGWTFVDPDWMSDRASEANADTDDLLALAGPGNEISFTAVPFGCEVRLGVDRDGDGYFDRDEIDAGADPGDPESTPENADVPGTGTDPASHSVALALTGAHPLQEAAQFRMRLPTSTSASVTVHDVSGRVVRPLLGRQDVAAGDHEVEWDLNDSRGREVPAGVYFVRLSSSADQATIRVVVSE